MTAEQIEESQENNRALVSRIMRNLASVNIHNPHFKAIKAILEDATGLEQTEFVGSELKAKFLRWLREQ